jgi:integrase
MSFVAKKKGRDYFILYEKVFDAKSKRWKNRQVQNLGNITRQEAKRYLQLYHTKQFISSPKEEPTTRLLLSAAIENYLDYGKKQYHSKRYTYAKKGYLYEFNFIVGNKYIDEIVKSDYEKFMIKVLMKRPLAICSQNNILKIFRSFFNYYIFNDLLEVNPVLKIRRIVDTQKEPFIPAEHQIGQLLTVAPLHMHYFINFLIYTGLRKGELLNLKLSSIDLLNNRIIIASDSESGFRTKNRKNRYIPIHPNLSEKITFLQNNWINAKTNVAFPRLKNQGYLFCHDDGSPFGDIRKSWLPIAKTAGFPGLKMHHLRHFFCSVLHKHTNDIFFVKEVLGHSDIKITQRYCHLLGDYKQQQMLKYPSIGVKAVENE